MILNFFKKKSNNTIGLTRLLKDYYKISQLQKKNNLLIDMSSDSLLRMQFSLLLLLGF